MLAEQVFWDPKDADMQMAVTDVIADGFARYLCPTSVA